MDIKYVSLRAIVQAQVGVTKGGVLAGGAAPQVIMFDGTISQDMIQGQIDNLKANGYNLFHAEAAYLLYAREETSDAKGSGDPTNLGTQAGIGDRAPGVPGILRPGDGGDISPQDGGEREVDRPSRPNLTVLDGGKGGSKERH